MAADWGTIKTEYVHGAETMRELAERHGIKAAGLMRRAAKEGWDAERKQKSAQVSKVASSLLTISRAEQLAEFNAADIAAAIEFKAKISALRENATTPQDVKTLVAAWDIAQKVGRLALGAETENSVVTSRELPASVDEFV